MLTCSALHETGLDRVWKHVQRHRDKLADDGAFDGQARRPAGGVDPAMVRDRLLDQLRSPYAQPVVAEAESAVLAGELTPDQAAEQILAGAGPAAPGRTDRES